MPDTQNPVELIKRAAVDAVEAAKPVQLLFGTVISVSPLQIQTDQKAIYTEKMLVLTRNVTDYTVFMTMEHETEMQDGTGEEPPFAEHRHAYQGKKSFLVHHALQAGERVVLMRMQNGRKFVVLDRVGV